MKAFLMYPDRDVNLQQEAPPNEQDLIQDLELDTLFQAMSRGDKFLYQVANRVLLGTLAEPSEIIYRQQVLGDCLEQSEVVRGLYDLSIEAIVGEKRFYFGIFRASPETILHRSLEVMHLFVRLLKQLRATTEEHAADFTSPGFTRFFEMLSAELDDAYFQEIEDHLAELRFRRGVLISARLGAGNKGVHYVLRRPPERSWIKRLTQRGSRYGFQIPDRDENGFRSLAELRDQGVNLVANALAQSVDHILSFFVAMRSELAFYVGCLNLHETLTGSGGGVCFPVPAEAGESVYQARGLYDACLKLYLNGPVVANDVHGDGKDLIMVTGANQGGKSTFLRSVGVAQLMMQAGMFVSATSLTADVRTAVFSHYKRAEDSTMTSGKFDEELGRMSEIVAEITPGCLLLCNESFAATNEREGSEIARQVVRALTESGVKVWFVTHLYDLAHGLHERDLDTALFLRAERKPDGSRTFCLREAAPSPTSHGEDLYRRIFAPDDHARTGAR